MERLKPLSNFIGSLSSYLIPKLQLGNAGQEALASMNTREARASQLNSQARAWELEVEGDWKLERKRASKLEETSIRERLVQFLNILLLLTLPLISHNLHADSQAIPTPPFLNKILFNKPIPSKANKHLGKLSRP